MGLNWPRFIINGGDMDVASQKAVRALLNDFGDSVFRQLSILGLPPHASPFFRPFSLVALRDRAQVLVGLGPASGVPQLKWLDRPTQVHAPAAMTDLLRHQLGWEISAVITLPLSTDPQRATKIKSVASAHVKEVEAMNALGKLGDIQHVRHLENYLRTFLEDHP